MKVDVELEPFTPLLRPTYADAHAGAISEVRMEGYEFGHTYVWQGPDTACAGTSIMIGGCISSKPDSDVELQPESGFDQREPQAPAHAVYATTHYQTSRSRSVPEKSVDRSSCRPAMRRNAVPSAHSGGAFLGKGPAVSSTSLGAQMHEHLRAIVTVTDEPGQVGPNCRRLQLLLRTHRPGGNQTRYR